MCYEKPGHVLLSTLSNEEVNKVLLNVLVRVRSKVHFCVQLRIDDAISQRRYYVGIQKKGENICISYMHQVPFTPQQVAYLWPEHAKVSDITLDIIRQALDKADEVNLKIQAPYKRFPSSYGEPVTVSDGNIDKAVTNDAADLPSELLRSTQGQMENAACPKGSDEFVSKVESPTKRVKQEQIANSNNPSPLGEEKDETVSQNSQSEADKNNYVIQLDDFLIWRQEKTMAEVKLKSRDSEHFQSSYSTT